MQAPRQERALFELRSNKKRREFFSRLYHRYADVLVTESMAPLAQSPPTEIVRLLRAHGAAECAYLMSYHEELDRRQLSLEEGVALWSESTMPTIVICEDELALFKGELDDAPPQFLIKGALPKRHGS